ncbi:helix-turn-helix transcriptional regulator [Brevibacillus brevis]|uniref:helix-turn-helix transcriptional regulator n=1 Tax=Brevibacillus brevis TaxID=1393 RepID=UPI00115B116C|nr:helix-turn-helix transcriptional regulator [Lysinibacillus sp. SDF0063]TQR29424.1 XRE family transcriptional regulator [Lysinibacillus sp. SDF0063]
MDVKIGRCRLRSLLRARKITQIRFAEIVGMSKQQINDYVKNRVIMSIETAMRFAIILECRIEDLYEWVEVYGPRRKG